MTTHPEAHRLNLEYYRKAAKALLKAAQSGDAAQFERIARHSNKPLALNQAQLTIAREQGFASWPRFRAFLSESVLDFPQLLSRFVDAATEHASRANEMLARHPEIITAGLYPALVLGDTRAVELAIGRSPAIVKTKGGPLDREPLLYVCLSRMDDAKLAETARVLIRAGADVNGYWIDPSWPKSRLSCLYAATGRNNHPVLARVLLEAGAWPDDGESLYHSTEHPDLACVRLLLEYGASPDRANALKHMLDYESIEGVRALLAAGADPNDRNPRGETALYWAVWRGRSEAIVAQLLDAGADIDTMRNDGRTAYAIAVRSGQREIAALLERRGANTKIADLDRFMGACADADPKELRRMTAGIILPAEYAQLMPELASSHRTSAVRALLAAGVPPNTTAPDGGATALHRACWKGYADLVKLLLDHGAAMTIEDTEFHATPVGWFSHGFVNSPERDGDYVETARLLKAAGAAIQPTGDPNVDAALA
jgi:ankyrin repeat protein